MKLIKRILYRYDLIVLFIVYSVIAGILIREILTK
jgi:hypothetical protein